MESDYLEVLYRALLEEQADIAISTYRQFNVDDNCYYFHAYQRGYDRKVFTSEELIGSLSSLNQYDNTYIFVSCKLVSKRLLKYIHFNHCTSYGEDMEYWYKLYLTAKTIVYENKDTYTYRTGNDSLKHFEIEKIRSDIQQRLNFIAVIAARGMDVATYVNDCITYLHFLETKFIEEEQQSNETVRWLKEILFLLEGF